MLTFWGGESLAWAIVRSVRRTGLGCALVLCVAALAPVGCRETPHHDSSVDAGIDAEARLDAGVRDSSPDGEIDAGGDAEGDAEAAGPCGITQEEQALLNAETHAFLTRRDDTLLVRYDEAFGHHCFEALAAAIRSWPREDVAPPEDVVEAIYEVPLIGDLAELYIFVPETVPIDGSERVPLILWLHGAGGNGASIASSARYQEVAEELGAILAAPSAPADCDWSADDRCAGLVRGAIDHVKASFPIDHDRVFLTGHSMGGRGTLSVGLSFPGEFAGLVAVAGSIGAIHDTEELEAHEEYVRPHVENAARLRTRIITGLDDHPLLVLQNQATANVMYELEYDFRWDALEGVGHAMQMEAWSEAIAWASAFRREPNPRAIHYTMAEHASSLYEELFLNVTNRSAAYWLLIDMRRYSQEPARVHGEIEGQQISVTTENVDTLTVFLSDDLVELDEDIVITINDQPWFEGRVERDPLFALAWSRQQNERSIVFAAGVTDDIPWEY